MNDSMPGCIGFFGFPIPPNGPCEVCRYKQLCNRVQQKFVPKTKLQPILAKLERLEAVLREARGERIE
jgi:hypothetical protein